MFTSCGALGTKCSLNRDKCEQGERSDFTDEPIDDIRFLLDLRQWTVAHFLDVQVEIQALRGELRATKLHELANTRRITEKFFAIERPTANTKLSGIVHSEHIAGQNTFLLHEDEDSQRLHQIPAIGIRGQPRIGRSTVAEKRIVITEYFVEGA